METLLKNKNEKSDAPAKPLSILDENIFFNQRKAKGLSGQGSYSIRWSRLECVPTLVVYVKQSGVCCAAHPPI